MVWGLVEAVYSSFVGLGRSACCLYVSVPFEAEKMSARGIRSCFTKVCYWHTVGSITLPALRAVAVNDTRGTRRDRMIRPRRERQPCTMRATYMYLMHLLFISCVCFILPPISHWLSGMNRPFTVQFTIDFEANDV